MTVNAQYQLSVSGIPLFLRIAAVCLPLAISSPVQAQNTTSGNADWLSFSFEQQSRIQFLDGQFRAGLEGSDKALELRNTLTVEATFDSFSITTEFADMRTYLGDSDTPLDTTTTNPLDILQANVSFPVANVFNRDNTGFVKIGRFSMDQGNRRWVARNRYRNTINSFSGVHAKLSEENSSYEFFYTLPTTRRFDDDAIDNQPRMDNEPGDTIFWGALFQTRLTEQADFVETYLYGLEENRDAKSSRERVDILSTGIRLFRSPAVGKWHYEAEGLLQFGDAPALTPLSAQRDHRAKFLHLEAGYSFDLPWRPRLSVIYDYASGDKDPLDDENNSFDSLYGVPRPEFGPTGLYRAFVRNNVNTPGLVLNLQPSSNVDAYIKLQDYSLAAEEQGWKTTSYRHPGSLGEDHVGTQLETRVRWFLFSRKLNIDAGYTWLHAADYMKLVNKDDAHYFYLQTIVRL